MNDNNISSGNNSTNIQGSKSVTVNNNTGLNYIEVKEVAMDVFKSNFYDLGKEVQVIAQQRAEEICDEFLNELKNINPNLINKTIDPDIRYAIYEAQKNYARRGNKDVKDLLVKALIERISVENKTMQEIVLNEALDVIPKLTSQQVDVLSFIYLIKNLTFNFESFTEEEIQYYAEDFCRLIKPITKSLLLEEKEDIYCIHLEYASCISINKVNYIKFITNMKEKFKGLEENKIENIINSNKEFLNIKNKWDNTVLGDCDLTSVGMVIAMLNINAKTQLNINLDIFN